MKTGYDGSAGRPANIIIPSGEEQYVRFHRPPFVVLYLRLKMSMCARCPKSDAQTALKPQNTVKQSGDTLLTSRNNLVIRGRKQTQAQPRRSRHLSSTLSGTVLGELAEFLDFFDWKHGVWCQLWCRMTQKECLDVGHNPIVHSCTP